MTQVRESDHAEGAQQFLTMDRKIPVPWLVSVLAGLALALGGMYFQGQRTAEKTADIASDVKSIKEEQSRQSAKAVEDTYMVRDLSRRLTVLEAGQQATNNSNKASK